MVRPCESAATPEIIPSLPNQPQRGLDVAPNLSGVFKFDGESPHPFSKPPVTPSQNFRIRLIIV